MNKEFLQYEQALALKELGFDEPCFGYYTYKGEIKRYTNFDGDLNKFQSIKNSKITMGNDWVTAPTFSQAFRWFEDNHSMFIERLVSTSFNEIIGITYNIQSWKFPPVEVLFENVYDSFDKSKAELACLKKLIEIVKEDGE